MRKKSVGLCIVLGIVALAAILPKIVFCFLAEVPFIEQLLKAVIYIGSLALIWFIMTVVILLLNAAGMVLVPLFGGDVDDFDMGVAIRSMVISAILIIIMQFIDAWGIKAGFIEWVLYQLFPFLK